MNKKKLLIMLLLVTLLSVVIVACNNTPKPQTDLPGTGVYYYDATDGVYMISLNKGNTFTYLVRGDNKSGTYTLDGETLTLTFNEVKDQPKDNAIIAAYKDRVITYDNMRFLEMVTYTVTFDSCGGNNVASVSVLNGRSISKPNSPTRVNNDFYGWYNESSLSTPFMFDTQPITQDTTLYARWEEARLDQTEFTVDFDLCFDTQEILASKTTSGAKLYNVSTPIREGYVFKGWWVSMFDNKDKLSYPWSEDMKFEENTTLFALWQSTESIAPKLTSPIVRVESNTVRWDVVSNASQYRISIVGPEGFAAINKTQGGTTPVTFASTIPGEYVVTVTAEGAGGSNASNPTVRYYNNKALARVSLFSVAAPSTLIFNPVTNATSYIISVTCGDDSHNHSSYNLKNTTSFNFANCPMGEEGIKFKVTAQANGFAPSQSREYVYNRVLDKVTGFYFNEATQTLSWAEVLNATNYIIGINDGQLYSIDNGSKTSISLKEYAPKTDGIIITVFPATKGYNSPEYSSYTFNKTTLKTPSNIRIEGTTIVWAEVSNAVSYGITINGATFTSDTTSLQWPSSINIEQDTVYELKVKAVASTSATDSLWSDAIVVKITSLDLSYSQNVVSWNYVYGATLYEVKVNEGEWEEVNPHLNNVEIDLTKSGVNTIYVRYFDGTDYSEIASVDVLAHTVKFDILYNGTEIEPLYKAYGDKINLPQPEREGYDFTGWYTSIGNGTSRFGLKYTDTLYAEFGDLTLYANWGPQKYTVTYDLQEGTGVSGSVKVTYDSNYEFGVPTIDNEQLEFIGWYSEPNGNGTRFTNELGQNIVNKQVKVWSVTEDITVYAYYGQIFTYTAIKGDTEYAISKGSLINEVSTIVIPSTYNGMTLSEIRGNAFLNCTSLINVSIPACVIFIDSTAFNGCAGLTQVDMEDNAIYSSIDGVLFIFDESISITNLHYYPHAKPGAYTIPDFIKSIGVNTFAKRTGLTKITIHNSITSISTTAFSGCSNLAEVIFEDGTEALTIGTNAFLDCTSLVNINLPSRLTSVAINTGTSAVNSFSGCINLENINVAAENKAYSSIDGVLLNSDGTTLIYYPLGKEGAYTIPEGVKTVGAYSFYDHAKITNIVISNTVTSIEIRAFAKCLNVISITFKAGGTEDLVIGDRILQSTVVDTNLTTVIFEEGCTVASIGQYAFQNRAGIVEITFPASLNGIIGASSFNGCSALTTITFRSGSALTSIKGSAFNNTGLVSVNNIPASVEEIAYGAFGRNAKLITVTFEISQTDEIELYIDDNVFVDCSALKSIDFPSRVSNLYSSAFGGCIALTDINIDNDLYSSVNGVVFDTDGTRLYYYPLGRLGAYTIPEGVTHIGSTAFDGQVNITEITFSKSLTHIGSFAFGDCSKLDLINFNGAAVIEIGASAFRNCVSLTSISIPSSVISIGSLTFAGCTNLTQIIADESNTVYSTIDGVLFDTEGTRLVYYPIGKTSQEYVVPNGVTHIADYAFYYMTNLTSVTLPDTLTHIGTYAFQNFTSLTSITIPSTVVSIGTYAFYNCSGLTAATILEGEADLTIGNNAFQGCTTLASVNIPNRVTSIGNNAFYGCSALSALTIAAGEKALTIGTYVFQNCISLASVNIPSRVTSIGNYAFASCTALSSVTIAEEGTALTIGTYVFQKCTALTTITIPAKVTVISSNAFNGWTAAQKIIVKGRTAAPAEWDKNWNQNCLAVIEWVA